MIMKFYCVMLLLIHYLGIVKMNHGAIILDHVDLLNAGDVVD